MALTLANGFDGGTAGNSLTGGSGGNTGGSSGNFFDTITINATCTCQFTASSYRGAGACSVSSGGTSGQGAVNWTSSILSAIAHGYGRIIGNASSFATAFPFMRVRGGAQVQAARLSFDTLGHVQLRNGSNSVVGTSSTALSTLAWWMVRWDIPVGSSQTGVVYIHTDPTTGTATEVMSIPTVNFGTNSINECNYGIAASTANVSAFLFDDVLLTDQGLPGPPIQSITISDSASGTDSVSRALLLPRSVSDTAAGSDTTTRGLILPRSVTDSAAGSDATVRGLLLPRSLADSASGTDTVARALLLPRGVADPAAGSDTTASNVTLPRTAADSASGVDSTASNVSLPRAAGDSAAGMDAASGTVALPRGTSDSAAGTDSAVRTVATARAVTDPAAGSDGATRVVTLTRTVTDSAAGSDFVTVVVPGSEHDRVFTFAQPIGKWTFRPPEPGPFAFGNPIGKWGWPPLMLTRSVLSTDWVRVPLPPVVENGQAVNPTSDEVQIAFPATGVNPVGGDWLAAEWETATVANEYFARVNVGPGASFALTVGVYDVWIKVFDNPSTPVARTGQIEIV